MIDFKCPGCAKSFSVKDDFAGKKTKCPKCGAALLVPTPAKSPPPASANPFEISPDTTGNAPENTNAPAPRHRLAGKAVVLGCGGLLAVLLGVLTVVIVAVAWKGTGGGGGIGLRGDDFKIGGGGAKGKAMEISARQIHDAYQANAIAADEKFKGKVVHVEGVALSIDGNNVVKVSGRPTYGGYGFACKFDENQKGALAKLSAAQIIAIRGIFGGQDRTINSCELVEPKKINLELSSSQFTSEWVADRDLAKARYAGNVLLVTGTVKSVDAVLRWVFLDGNDEKLLCICSQTTSPESVTKLSQGQLITVRGVFGNNPSPTLANCELVK